MSLNDSDKDTTPTWESLHSSMVELSQKMTMLSEALVNRLNYPVGLGVAAPSLNESQRLEYMGHLFLSQMRTLTEQSNYIEALIARLQVIGRKPETS
jgi:hypothetical protein